MGQLGRVVGPPSQVPRMLSAAPSELKEPVEKESLSNQISKLPLSSFFKSDRLLG
jgi:hypothetical protein